MSVTHPVSANFCKNRLASLLMAQHDATYLVKPVKDLPPIHIGTQGGSVRPDYVKQSTTDNTLFHPKTSIRSELNDKSAGN